MLSVFDLMAAGTLDLDLAAYLTARISRGASFLVGAMPGGAGKTTVMCALLNLVPAEVVLTAATPEVLYGVRGEQAGRRFCYICHEIGPGTYYAYLWGGDLRRYCDLGGNRNMLAANLHADDVRQARDQICCDNGVCPEHFDRFNLLIFLRVEGALWNARRRIEKVHDRGRVGRHRLIHDAATASPFSMPSDGDLVDVRHLEVCRDFLKQGLDAGTRTIEQTRRQVLELLAGHP